MNLTSLMTAILLAAALAIPGLGAGASTQTAPVETEAMQENVFTLNATVTEVTPEGLLVETENGPVLALLQEDTLLEGFEALEDLAPGRQVEILYNGVMTRSLPGQINAQRITSCQLAGTVTEVLEGSFLMETSQQGPVMVNLPEEITAPQVGQQVLVTFNGVMTLSLPGQINPWTVEVAKADEA